MKANSPRRKSRAKPAQEPAESDETFPIVGIGASSGGVAALRSLFSHMPPDSGMAFVVILHLPPEFESNLASVLQQVTSMPVTQVLEPTQVLANHVYVIPPSKHLSMADGSVQLTEPEGPRGRRAPIDLFFRTLAETHAQRAAAIVLSGSGADGTIGVQRIKERGGVVLVQDPAEAEFDAMPRNVIATSLVDFILAVADMPGQLIAYWRTAATMHLPAEAVRPELEADTLREIFALLRARTGHDFSQYKRPTLLRRIGRRMQVTGMVDLAAYLAVLRSRPDEVQALLRDLLISVTNFFRDTAAWHALTTVLPAIFAGKDPGEQICAWVAGCATGEEAYSVAILLYECALLLDLPPTIQVFATDIDEDAIGIARQGVYPDTIAADVAPERLQRFFQAEQGRYRIKKEIRDLVLFAPHNLLRDPPFSKLDLITCRNLLIYLNRDVQEQVLQLFHFVLRPEGVMLLGASESTDGVPGLFVPIDKSQRLFQRRLAPSAAPSTVPGLPLVGPPHRPQAAKRGPSDAGLHSFGELHSQLLANYIPPSVIVNEDYDIVHLSRGVGTFLQFIEGEPSHNLLKVVHPDLRLELRTALFAAMQKISDIEIRRVRIATAGGARLVDLIVRPLQAPEWARGYVLVVFRDLADASTLEPLAPNDAEPVVRQLEDELQRTKDQLRTTIEQYETAVEEYKAANEELQAINKELRAATEELETSKEELQSVNEELTTVNQELKHKVDEVSQSNNDLLNLMASTEIGTIFVDREMRIKRYTPSAQVIFNLIPSDINRPLAHITHKLSYTQLAADAMGVLETLAKVEREVASQDARWYLARLLPYRTVEDKIDGVILTFIDITERKRAEEALQASENRLRLLFESVQDFAIFTLDLSGRIDSWSPAAERLLGYSEAEVLGQPGALVFTPEDRAQGAPEQELQQTLQRGRSEDERWQVRKDGSRFYASSLMSQIHDARGTAQGFVKVMRDLTRQKHADDILQQGQVLLEQRVDERTRALAIANQQLQAEVADRQRAELARSQVLRQLVTAQEEERRRIARELHDQLGQQLSALRIGLDQLAAPRLSPARAEQLARLQQIAHRLDRDVDQLAFELRPSLLDDLGLRAALQQHVEEWAERHGIAAEFQAMPDTSARLAGEIEIVVYRVVQEALTNVLKHADAHNVSVILEQHDNQLSLIVEDDGIGFDTDAASTGQAGERRLGLLGIHERVALVNGTVTIESARRSGTTLFIRIPLGPRGGADATS